MAVNFYHAYRLSTAQRLYNLWAWIAGMEAVDKIADSQVEPNAFGEVSKPVTPTVVKSVEIAEG